MTDDEVPEFGKITGLVKTGYSQPGCPETVQKHPAEVTVQIPTLCFMPAPSPPQFACATYEEMWG